MGYQNRGSSDISYNIEEKLALVSTNDYGWTIELNKISWNGRPAKVDLRSWAPDHAKMGKGITLTDQEAKLLAYKLLKLYGKSAIEEAVKSQEDKEQAANRPPEQNTVEVSSSNNYYPDITSMDLFN